MEELANFGANWRFILVDSQAAAKYCQALPFTFTWKTPPSSAWRKYSPSGIRCAVSERTLQLVHREGRTLRPCKFSPSIIWNPNLTRYRTPVGRVGTKTPEPVRVLVVILAIATYLMHSINKRFPHVKKIPFACVSPCTGYSLSVLTLARRSLILLDARTPKL